ncbi:KR domain-containing protein [Hirsutella rhossiliensis]|uniref:KR domain-containing protein n=1 Tax=Hirsutella rhossiliensis TaxID=111463 RepID=A0A9P8MVW1_9HYPO|nr:KR domain-containing protein [Hirsutella rhossiliensis]KAH0962357.1 KR domain-containing protein [Hirsutella rhossiliensis]
MPKNRFNADAFYHPNPDRPGSFNPQGAHFLDEDVGLFDAPFFNMTRQEACALDPQQRILLECVYEALENAGVPGHSIVRRNVGVFCGASFPDYDRDNNMDMDSIPILTIDTACSSSLTALHIACQSIRNGECSMAIVAGCHLNISPDSFIVMSRGRLVSDSGKSFAFDHRASGFGRGEGAGCIILKSLADAETAGDAIRCLIVNSGLNQDGRTNGISMPSPDAQEALIRSVYKSAQAAALRNALILGTGRGPSQPLLVGSVKSNVGHTEGASGIISVIKTALMLERGLVLPNCNFEKANEEIPLDKWNMKVPTTVEPWPDKKPFASINNFGFGGANAHVVLYVVSGHTKETVVRLSKELGVFSIIDELVLKDPCESSLGTAYVSQPACTAIQLALVDLLSSWGVRPRAVVGHSSGEIAAAYAAGVLTLEASVKVAYSRGVVANLLATDTSINGAMLAVGTNAKVVEQALGMIQCSGAVIACVNSESSVTLSGDRDVIADLEFGLGQKGIWTRRLEVDVGYHSHHMQRVLPQYRSLLAGLCPRPSQIPFYSTLTGQVSPGTYLDASYWVDNLASRVEFVKGLASLLAADDSINTLVEIGPHPALKRPVRDVVRTHEPNRQMRFGYTLERNVHAVEALQNLAVSLFTRGVALDFRGINFPNLARGSKPAALTNLPKYPWNHSERYWSFNRRRDDILHPKYPRNDILGTPAMDSVDFEPRWRNVLRVDDHPWIRQHRIHGINIYPMTGFLSMAVEAIAQQAQLRGLTAGKVDLRDVSINGALAIADDATVETMLTLRPRQAEANAKSGLGWHEFSIFSWAAGRGWEQHCHGSVMVHETKPLNPVHGSPSVDDATLYDSIAKSGVEPGRSRPASHCHTPKATLVPSHINHLYGHRLGSQSADKNRITAVEPDNPDKAVFELEGISVVPIANHVQGYEGNAPDPLCYKLDWEPCFELLSVDDIRLLAPLEGGGSEAAGEQLNQIDDDATEYLRRSLQAVTAQELSALPQHHQQFYRWAQQHAWSRTANNTYRAKNLLSVLGELLPQILHGQVDALSVMLEDDRLGKLYESLESLRQCYASASFCMDKMAHQNPDLNIIEIGAGTGGATLPILQSLGRGGDEPGSMPRFRHYTYTDISPGFFEKAKTKLERWSHHLTYQTLDISTDPSAQGFKPGSYDVVVACNVLHATADIKETMANVRSLLRPGGKVLLIEETVFRPRHFPFALLPGWWLASDEFRKGGPLLSIEQWHGVMKATGFSGIDVSVEDHPGSPHMSGCFMVTTATGNMKRRDDGEVVVIGGHGLGTQALRRLEQGLTDMTGQALVTVPDVESADAVNKWCVLVGGIDGSPLSHLTREKLEALQQLVCRTRGLLWVVRHARSNPESVGGNMAAGLARSIRSETGLKLATLDLGDKDQVNDSEAVNHILGVFNGIFFQGASLMRSDMEFAVRKGHVSVPRLVVDTALNLSIQQDCPDAPPSFRPFSQDRALHLMAGLGGQLDELYWTDDVVYGSSLPDDHIEVQVCCAGLNFRDVLMAMRQLEGHGLGQECSGIVTRVGSAVTDFSAGDRVCALSPASLSTYTRCPASCAHMMPDDMPWEVAASLPAVFSTAYYSLVDMGRLTAGESVLIHAAAGGVGQAAIIVSQSIGAEIFATVGSQEKKEFLMATYQLDQDHIFFSRDLAFIQAIRNATGGQGVDVALNSLGGDALQATFECVAPFGRCIELGKRDIVQNSRLEMAHFNNNLLGRLLRDSFRVFVDSQAQSWWPVNTQSISDIEAAFRSLQTGRVIGKTVVQMTKNARVKVHPPRKPVHPLRPDATYIVVGGTGGIGLDIASWLPQQGARRLVLVSRSGASTQQARQAMRDLTGKGVAVHVCRCDVSDAANVQEKLIPLLDQVPPVYGVVFGAMVLRDVVFEKATFNDWDTVIKPRVHGIWNLERALQSVHGGHSPDFFITLSSAASTIGNIGQAAYAASGTFMSALAQYTRTRNMPFTSIELPYVRGVGYLANDPTTDAASRQMAIDCIDASDIRRLMAAAIRNEMRDTCEGHCVVGFHSLEKMPATKQPFYVKDAKFSHLKRLRLLKVETASARPDQTSNSCISSATALQQAQGREAAKDVVVAALLQKASAILQRPIDCFSAAAPVSAYGLDSLVSIEFRSWIAREFEVYIQVMEILTSVSFNALAEIILKRANILSLDVKQKWGLHV